MKKGWLGKMRKIFLPALFITLFFSLPSGAQEFKKWEGKIQEYKTWLEGVGVNGSRFWLRLDSERRPHRLYLGDGFKNADYKLQEEFVEIFSRYLAGHPEKHMLIDLFDAESGLPIGEFGCGGFKLYRLATKSLINGVPTEP